MFKDFLGFLILTAFIGLGFLGGYAVSGSVPRPSVTVAPLVRPYDVTFNFPGEGVRTTIVDSSNFLFKDGCVVSTAPKLTIVCNIIMVSPCTESCQTNNEAPSEAPVPNDGRAPAVLEPLSTQSNLIARS